MVLEPIEDILALDVAVKAEERGDVLDLVGGGSSETRGEEVSQKPELVRCGIPTPALGPAAVTPTKA